MITKYAEWHYRQQLCFVIKRSYLYLITKINNETLYSAKSYHDAVAREHVVVSEMLSMITI